MASGSRARLNASAVFAPTSTEQVASGVKVLEFFKRQFAIRGRGYTMIPGMAGIEDGVLIALENMNSISLNPSGEVVSIGPGNHWGRVYEALEAKGVAVPGGQLAVVGVPGFLTGSMFPPLSLWLSVSLSLFPLGLLSANHRFRRIGSLPRQPWLLELRCSQL